MDYPVDVYESFSLMAAVTFGARKGMDAALKAVDMTFAQYGALMMLERQPGITQTELAQLLSTDTTTAMVICDSLQKKDRIRRVPDARDRRVNRLEMTAEGREAFELAIPIIFGFYKPMMEALSEQEWAALRGMVEKLRGKLPGHKG